jgi:RNA polymerase sigma factor (sigma-70 family)
VGARAVAMHMMNDPDERLWRQALTGDTHSFGVIFERHAKRVYNHCFRRVADWAMAEDLTSVVFLEAWRKRESVHFVDESALPWLLGVATNVCRNATRSLRRHGAALQRLPKPETTDDLVIDLVERVDAEAQMKLVLECVSGLNRGDREIIELWAWDGLGYDEIAVALDIPVGTVRSRLSRARARLRNDSALRPLLGEEDA